MNNEYTYDHVGLVDYFSRGKFQPNKFHLGDAEVNSPLSHSQPVLWRQFSAKTHTCEETSIRVNFRFSQAWISSAHSILAAARGNSTTASAETDILSRENLVCSLEFIIRSRENFICSLELWLLTLCGREFWHCVGGNQSRTGSSLIGPVLTAVYQTPLSSYICLCMVKTDI